MILTKEEALSTLKLVGPSPSLQDIQMRYYKMALKWCPSKHYGDPRAVLKFDKLCRSYIILTEGRDSIDKMLTSAEMLDVFVKAFELDDPEFKSEVAAQDICMQGNKWSHIPAFYDWLYTDTPAPPNPLNEWLCASTCTRHLIDRQEPLAASASTSASASAKYEDSLAGSASTECKKPPSTEGSVLPGVGVGARELHPTAAALVKKPLVTEKPNQNGASLVPAPSTEKLTDKKARNKTSKKTAKRRKQREKEGSKKASMKEDRCSSSDDSGSEEEKKGTDEELDLNSAFVAIALSRKAKGANGASGGVIPKVSKKSGEDVIIRSQRLAREGYELCTVGRCKEAVDLFTQAIKLYPQDRSYFGNRSYCYTILGNYDKALKDAEKAISLQPQLAMGYFRRGRAQLGLQKYSEAAESFRKVLSIDADCHEAKTELHNVCVFEVMSMGFTQEQAEWSVTKGNNDVQEAINLLFGPDAVKPDMKLNPINLEGSQSLWIGNIKPEVTEKMLINLFRRFGDIHSIRILHDRHCAFINYSNKVSPGKAMAALQGHVLCGREILIRFPDRNFLEKPSKSFRSGGEDHTWAGASNEPKAKLSGPVNGNECYFWRTSGCIYGELCYYEHVPSHKGIDWVPQSNSKFK